MKSSTKRELRAEIEKGYRMTVTNLKFKQIVQTMGDRIVALSTKGDMYIYNVKKDEFTKIVMGEVKVIKIKTEKWE